MNKRAEEKLSSRKTKVPNWYLDLSLLNKYWGSDRVYHHTAPVNMNFACLLYTSPSPRDSRVSRMPSSA